MCDFPELRLCVGDGEARADRQGGKLIDGIAFWKASLNRRSIPLLYITNRDTESPTAALVGAPTAGSVFLWYFPSTKNS
jgi:hypothetical protein